MTLNEFRDKYLKLGKVEYHSYGNTAYFQCTDLANQYIVEVLGLTPIIGTNASDFLSKAKTDEFKVIKNTPTGVPQAGDVIVWNNKVGGGAGHVAIVLEADVNTFKSLDQNWSKVERITIETHNYNNVSGWLSPIKAGKPIEPITLDPTKKLPNNFYLIKEFERAKTLYDVNNTDAFDTILGKANDKVATQDTKIKDLENKHKSDKAEIKRLAEELNALARNHQLASEALVEARKQVESAEPCKDNATLSDMPKTDSTNLNNVTITLSTVIYTFIEYVKQTYFNGRKAK